MIKIKDSQPILFAILSGLLLIFSYPTFPYSILAWGALVPLLLAIDKQSLKRTALLGFITGFIYFYGILYWLNILYKFSWLIIPGLILAAGYLSLYFIAFLVVLNWLFPKQNYIRLLFIPLLWVSLEYFRQIGIFGFSWGILGYTQYKNIPLIQLASITSVLGLSFLIVLVNAGIAYVIQAKQRVAPTRELILIIIGIPIIFILVLLFGTWQIHQYNESSSKKINVAVIQGNIPQDLKWDETKEKEHQEIHFSISESVASTQSPDLIVLPETAITEFLPENPILISRFQELAKKHHTQFLIGSPDLEIINAQERIYNSVFQINAEQGIVKKYDKTALVPFGEYVPFSDQFPQLRKVIQGPGDFTPGNKYTQFTLYAKDSTPIQFTTVICFESIMPQVVRRFMRNPVDFLVIITNDAWFGKTEAPYQHAYMAVFRAVENRTSIVRCANTGYSCFINSIGRIKSGLNIYTRGYLIDKITLRNVGPFYCQYGDIFAYLCIIFVLIFAGLSFRLRK